MIPAGQHFNIHPTLYTSMWELVPGGPYSYLAGAMALDFGSKQGAATSSGIIDGVGYLGGILSGDAVARISLASGWQGAFVVLGAVTAFSTLAAAYFLVLQRRPVAPATDTLVAS